MLSWDCISSRRSNHFTWRFTARTCQRIVYWHERTCGLDRCILDSKKPINLTVITTIGAGLYTYSQSFLRYIITAKMSYRIVARKKVGTDEF